MRSIFQNIFSPTTKVVIIMETGRIYRNSPGCLCVVHLHPSREAHTYHQPHLAASNICSISHPRDILFDRGVHGWPAHRPSAMTSAVNNSSEVYYSRTAREPLLSNPCSDRLLSYKAPTSPSKNLFRYSRGLGDITIC